MTVIDLRKYCESRQRAGWQKSETEQKREIEEIRSALDQWAPLIEEVIANEKAHARLPRCEGPGCSERTESVHRVQARSSAQPVQVRLCDMHLDVVRCGCLTLVSGEPDTLVWEWDVVEGVPRKQIRVRRRTGSKLRRAEQAAARIRPSQR